MLYRIGLIVGALAGAITLSFAAGRHWPAANEVSTSIPQPTRDRPIVGTAGPMQRWLARGDIFPVGVWLQSPLRAAQYHQIGVNMFVGVNGQTSADDLARFRALDMIVIAAPTSQFPTAVLPEVAPAWLLEGEEPDNAQPNGAGGYGPCRSVENLAKRRSSLRRWDRRPTMTVFGRGVAEPSWPGRGACTGQLDNYYPGAIRSADIISFDSYPVVSNGGRLELVAQGVRNLRRWMVMSGTRKPLWTFVEAAAIHGGVAPTQAQIRALIWLPIINRSDGLVLFPYHVTRAGTAVREDDLFAHTELVAAITAELRTLHSLASVLKKGREIRGLTAASPVPLSFRAISYGDTFIFAGLERSNDTDVTFQIPNMLNGEATVIGENRRVPIVAGRLVDHFTGYGVHIYQIASRETDADRQRAERNAS